MRPTRWMSWTLLGLVVAVGCHARERPGARVQTKSQAARKGNGQVDKGGSQPEMVKTVMLADPEPPPILRDPPRRPETAKESSLAWEIDGFGQTQRDAEEEALVKARQELNNFLAEQEVPLEWRPSLNYVRQLKKGTFEMEPKNFEGMGELQHVKVRVEVNARDYEQMQSEDRRLRAEERMVVLLHWLAGLVVVQFAVWGYLRLEEATKGYYTTWLRIAALGFVGVVGASLLVLSYRSAGLSAILPQDTAVSAP